VSPSVAISIPLLCRVEWEVISGVCDAICVVISIFVVTDTIRVSVNPLIRVSWEGICCVNPAVAVIVGVGAVDYAVSV